MLSLSAGAVRIWLTHDADGEFHVDLYTLPDNLIKLLWDYTSQKVDMSVLS